MKTNQHLNIAITPASRLVDIQKEFNEMFPYLKLEFFSTVRVGLAHKLSRKPLDPGMTVAHAQSKPAGATIEIHPALKVRELERILNDKLFLSAEVFRCSGKMWLQTTHTDEWTLEHQNNHGKEITDGSWVKDKTESDYDLSRDNDD